VLASLAPELRSRATERLDELVRLAGGITPPRRRALFGGPWWEEVDAVPSVDGRATVG